MWWWLGSFEALWCTWADIHCRVAKAARGFNGSERFFSRPKNACIHIMHAYFFAVFLYCFFFLQLQKGAGNWWWGISFFFAGAIWRPPFIFCWYFWCSSFSGKSFFFYFYFLLLFWHVLLSPSLCFAGGWPLRHLFFFIFFFGKIDNPDEELIPSEFVECIVRLAEKKFPKVRQLSERVVILIEVKKKTKKDNFTIAPFPPHFPKNAKNN